jgi:thiol-disulfide isomerase/thioredoxin/outer membrane lipoprotein-sorting protein
MFCLLLISMACGALQTPNPAGDSTKTLQILEQACRRYAEAKSYRIEQVWESTTSTELSRNWQKRFVTAIAAAENRYRYEVKSQAGNRLRVSDGKTEWIYHAEEKAYLRRPAPKDGPAREPVSTMGAVEEFQATQMRKRLAGFADNYVAAESGPDEALDLGGRRINCHVVRLGAGSSKKPLKAGSSMNVTVWIAKDDLTIRKIATRAHLAAVLSPGVLEDTESSELYPVVELGGAIFDSEFAFTPPATAAEVEAFSGPFASVEPSLQGKSAPAVTFKSAEGKETQLASFRGKPVLIDFWATWCAPCVAAMPEMEKLYQQTKDKGLVFISVDRDFETKEAADFWAKKQEPWPNYHDEGEIISKAFHQDVLPAVVLIDAQGKIVYTAVGYGEDSVLNKLREAIAALGPEYASIKTPAP